MCIWSLLLSFAALCVSIASLKLLNELRENTLRMQKQNSSKDAVHQELTKQSALMNNMDKVLKNILSLVVYDQKHAEEVKPKKKPPSK